MSIAAAAALYVLGGQVSRLHAAPLTLFRFENLAKQHCPGDTVVWLDFRKGRYYLKTQKLYAQGFNGSFVCQKEARGSGYRRALRGWR